jgi:hypothetical protein
MADAAGLDFMLPIGRYEIVRIDVVVRLRQR